MFLQISLIDIAVIESQKRMNKISIEYNFLNFFA